MTLKTNWWRRKFSSTWNLYFCPRDDLANLMVCHLLKLVLSIPTTNLMTLTWVWRPYWNRLIPISAGLQCPYFSLCVILLDIWEHVHSFSLKTIQWLGTLILLYSPNFLLEMKTEKKRKRRSKEEWRKEWRERKREGRKRKGRIKSL